MANQDAAGQIPGQPQMKRDDMTKQGQRKGIVEETGSHVKNMAQGAADVGKGAVQGAMSIAKGAVLGTANVAQGAADIVKNTFGNDTSSNPGNDMNKPANENSASNPSNLTKI